MKLMKVALLAAVCATALSTASFAKGGNWAGAYGGLSVGYLQDRSDFFDGDDYNCDGCWYSGDDSNHASFGLTAGYNWQDNKTVYGIEADTAAIFGEDNQTLYSDGIFQNQELNASASIRGRFGFVLDTGVLAYATGGISFLSAKEDNLEGWYQYNGATELFTGWIGGLGIEKNIAANYSFKLEGLYADYSSKTWYDAGDYHQGSDPETFGINAGVNYHF